MEKHIKTFVRAQVGQQKTIVEVHELLSSGGEGCVYLSITSIRTLPELRVTHSTQEVIDLLLLVLRIGLNLQTIDLLQDLGFLMEQELKSKLLLLLAQLGRALDLLCLIKAPSVELVAQDLEVFAFSRMHTALNLVLVLDFFLAAQVSLLHLQLVVLIGSLLTEAIGSASCEPSSHVTLNFESDCLTLFVPHGGGHILSRVDNLIITLIDIEARLLHLHAKLTHHLR